MGEKAGEILTVHDVQHVCMIGTSSSLVGISECLHHLEEY